VKGTARTAAIALAWVAVLGIMTAVLFGTAKRSALRYMAPLADLVTYDSAKFLVRGTSKESPSFLFLFKPDKAMDDDAVFYVETGLAGHVKRMVGPFVSNGTTSPAGVRAAIQERIEATTRSPADADVSP